MVIKSQIQRPICCVSNTNQKLWSSREQSECQISCKFMRPSFQTGASIAAILNSFGEPPFCNAFSCSPEGAGSFWNHSYRRLYWLTWYRTHLRVARTFALSPASSMLLAPRLVSQLAGIVRFALFLFSPWRHYTFASSCMIIHKYYVLVTADMTWTCYSKPKACPDCS